MSDRFILFIIVCFYNFSDPDDDITKCRNVGQEIQYEDANSSPSFALPTEITVS